MDEESGVYEMIFLVSSCLCGLLNFISDFAILDVLAVYFNLVVAI